MAKIWKPTFDEVLSLYDETKKRYEESGIYEEWDTDERFYDLDFSSQLLLPVEFQKEGVVLPTARDMVDACVDHTDIDNMRIFVGKKGESQKSAKEREMLRKFAYGLIHRNNVEQSISPFHVARKHYWICGMAVLKTVWDADRYIDKPERKEGESEEAYAARIDEWRAENHDSIPIVIQAVHPKNIMLDPFFDGGMFVFETRTELVYNVKQKFPSWQTDKKLSETVEHISFWSQNYRCELYDRQPVPQRGQDVYRHDYGFPPYVVIDSGLGTRTADNDLKKRYVGVLRYIRELILSESRNYSLGDIITKREIFPWGYLTGVAAENIGKIYQEYGHWQVLPEGVELHFMESRTATPALFQWIQAPADYIAAHAAPRVIRGMGESGVRSGSDRARIEAQAAMRYQYANKAFEHGIAKVLTNCARIMKNVVPGDLYVWARTPTDEFDVEIKKEDMKEPFTFYVECTSVNEEDEYRRHQDLIALSSGPNPIITKEYARSKISDADPAAMEHDELKAAIKAAVIPVFQQAAAAKAQIALQRNQAAEQLQAQPTTPAPMQAEPVAPENVIPGNRLVTRSPERAMPGSPEEIARQWQENMPRRGVQGQGGGGNRP